MNTKDAKYEQPAQLFRVLSHPARLQILDELRRGPACVCHLQTILDRPQAYVSQQLRVLREAGLLESTKEGLNVYYHIAAEQTLHLLDDVLGTARDPEAVVSCPCPKCSQDKCC